MHSSFLETTLRYFLPFELIYKRLASSVGEAIHLCCYGPIYVHMEVPPAAFRRRNASGNDKSYGKQRNDWVVHSQSCNSKLF